jgi:hypothetical protein
MPALFKPSRFLRAGFLVLPVLLLMPCGACAQFKFREPPNRQQPAALDEESGQQLWRWFLASRALGGFRLEGILTHRPAGAPSASRDFVLEGEWNPLSETTRITVLHDGDPQRQATVKWENGETLVTDPDGVARKLGGSDWNNGFIDGLPVTWMDLLMPYLRWETVRYAGPDRHLGRPAHRYELYPPDGDGFPARVTVTLDRDFAAILKVDLHDGDGFIARRMRVGGFRKFADQWMFSELNWEDRARRSSINLKVYSFSNTP